MLPAFASSSSVKFLKRSPFTWDYDLISRVLVDIFTWRSVTGKFFGISRILGRLEDFNNRHLEFLKNFDSFVPLNAGWVHAIESLPPKLLVGVPLLQPNVLCCVQLSCNTRQDLLAKLCKKALRKNWRKKTDQALRQSPCTPRQSRWGQRSCGWCFPPRNFAATFSDRLFTTKLFTTKLPTTKLFNHLFSSEYSSRFSW